MPKAKTVYRETVRDADAGAGKATGTAGRGHHEVSVPELIRTALRQHYGLPTESDRQPGAVRTKGRPS